MKYSKNDDWFIALLYKGCLKIVKWNSFEWGKNNIKGLSEEGSIASDCSVLHI